MARFVHDAIIDIATDALAEAGCARSGQSRFFHDGNARADVLYSYEGTREMNTLIVGKSITGLSAFV
jgi:hypothetical protein